MTGLVKAIGASNAVETVPIPGGEKQLSAQGWTPLMPRVNNEGIGLQLHLC